MAHGRKNASRREKTSIYADPGLIKAVKRLNLDNNESVSDAIEWGLLAYIAKNTGQTLENTDGTGKPVPMPANAITDLSVEERSYVERLLALLRSSEEHSMKTAITLLLQSVDVEVRNAEAPKERDKDRRRKSA